MTLSDAPTSALEETIEAADAPLLVVTATGNVLAANEAYRMRFGGPPRDLEGLRALGDEAAGASEAVDLASVVRRGEPTSGIATLRDAAGAFIRTGYSVTPIGDQAPYSGAILALQPLGSTTLRPGAAFEWLAETAPGIVWIAAPDGSIVFANRAWRGAFGVQPDEGAIAPSLTVLHPDDHDRCRALWESAVREGVMYEATARHRSTAGGYGRFVTRAVPLATEAGEVVGWFGTTTAVESEDDAAGSEAGRTEGASSEGLLAVASHEIRTPLAVLRGTVQLARRRAAGRQLSEEEVRETLESVEQQVDRTLLLVEQLLDHARLGVGRLELNRAACDVTALVRAVVERVTAGNDSHEIDVREAGPVTAEIDAPRIEQVLLNLLDNAIKFSPAGSRIDVRVVRVVSGATEVAEIAVRDRGRGVPTGERSLIFERFHQVTSDDAARGLGMGLAISKEIVELHGGTLAVGTPRGGGARFVVRLPVVRPAE